MCAIYFTPDRKLQIRPLSLSKSKGVSEFDVCPTFHGKQPLIISLPIVVVDHKKSVSRVDDPGKPIVGTQKFGDVVILDIEIYRNPWGKIISGHQSEKVGIKISSQKPDLTVEPGYGHVEPDHTNISAEILVCEPVQNPLFV